MHQKHRVAVTGMGVISPVGNTIDTAWQNLLAGRSGIARIRAYDPSPYQTQFAGEVRDFSPEAYGLTSKDTRHMDLFIQYGVAAAQQAFQDSGLVVTEENAARIGVLIGSGIGGLSTIDTTRDVIHNQGTRRVSPYFIPSVLINMVAGHVAIRHGLKGPNLAVSTACTTGTHAIGLAARLIASGDADVMLAGGAEYGSSAMSVIGFNAARALSTRNDAPELASRPFDRERDGFVIGDGSAIMVLESEASARKRGARIYAYLSGFGMSGDAYHVTQPSAEGPAQAMRTALADAQLTPEDIGYINAHATSTNVGDINETAAIKQVFKEHAHRLAVSATKSMTGHLLGAAGAIEAVFTVLSLCHQTIPPTINLENPDPLCDLDYVPNVARQQPLTACLSNSFGFGGTNGSLIFTRADS
ncbi:MAG: beta-ketoacyl-ACP synthase II [Pseudomonadota bacterium]